jgi:tetratricopeptide (TPR) repeat protein
MFCSYCGALNDDEAMFCTKCGRSAQQRPSQRPDNPEGVGRLTGDAAEEMRRPWYFSTLALFLSFLFLTPVWVILILADRSREKGLKIVAGLVGAAYIVLVIAVYEKSGVSPYNQGVQHLQAGETTLAEQEFKLALARNPNLAEAHLNLGLIYRQVGWLDGAETETRKAIEIFERTHQTIVAGETWQQSLSVAYNNLGALELARGVEARGAAQQTAYREAALADFVRL